MRAAEKFITLPHSSYLCGSAALRLVYIFPTEKSFVTAANHSTRPPSNTLVPIPR